MRLLFTIAFCFICLFSYCQAPDIEWEKSFGGTENDVAYSSQQTSDGGFIIAGYSASNDDDVAGNHGNNDYWVVKLNSQRKIQWQNSLGSNNDDRAESIQQTSDGGYIIAGYASANNGNVSGNHGSEDYWIVKLNTNGVIEWQKSFGGSKVDEAYCVKQTFDGGYIVAGSSLSNDGDITGNHNSQDCWIVKLTNVGTLQWEKSLGGSSYDYASSIQQTSDGGYIVAGVTASTDGDISGHHGKDINADYWIIKLNDKGNIVFQKTLGGNNTDYATSIEQTFDGGYIIAGSSFSTDGDVKGNHGKNDYWIIKLTNTGDIAWQKSLGGSLNDEANSIAQVSDGYIVAGMSASNDGDATGGHGNGDYWILKLNNAGKIIWQKSLGGNYIEEAYCISQTSDRGYIISGYSLSTDGDITNHHKAQDYWVVKIKPDNVLPINLLSFTAQKQNNTALLQWQTANEINNNYFDVERSANSKLFSSIGRKQGLNNDGISKYSFTDNAPLKGINYYRLRQVDKDGKYSYSGIASVEFLNDGSAFAVVPNPANNFINIIIPSSKSASEIIIYNVEGKKILREQIAANITSKQINISQLNAGVYNVVLIQNNQKKTMKLVKK